MIQLSTNLSGGMFSKFEETGFKHFFTSFENLQ